METYDDAGSTIELPLLEVLDYLGYIIESEPLIIKLQELQAGAQLQDELRAPWERFKAFLESPEPGRPEEAEVPSAEEPSENSRAALLQTRSEPGGRQESAAALAVAGSSYYCCILRRSGASTIRRTYNTSRYIATAKCRQLELASRPPRRTMTYPLPNRPC